MDCVRWAVVGIGDITRKRVIPAILSEPRSRLYGLVTRDPSKAAAYSGARVWTSIDDALRDPAVNAVYVASPVALHAPQTIASLRAGKHVLCEKPVAMDYAQAQAMLAASVESGRLLGIAYYRRLYPKLIRARELLAPVSSAPWSWRKHATMAGSKATRAPGCVTPLSWCEVRHDLPADPALAFLDPGERVAIALALAVRADRILIDDLAGRGEAVRRNLRVTGTLGVLAEAHVAGLLDFEQKLLELRQTNFYVSDEVARRVRQRLARTQDRP